MSPSIRIALVFLVLGGACASASGSLGPADPARIPAEPEGGSNGEPGRGAVSATIQSVGKAPFEKVTTVEGITEYRLKNGMRVLLYPDASKPTVTVNLTVFVGSRHEGYGESGMAHLLEHMLFKGTPTHANIWKLLQDRGANFNGTTWFDRTNYYEELPATPENLEFALRLEADRMMNSTISAEDLAKEFSVVRNEFEMGENDPTSVLMDKMMAAAFQWHNYGKTTIGSRSDIERVPVENLRAFYRRFYQPDNAMLVVAGKFDENAALVHINRTFGTISAPKRKLDRTWTEEPVQDGERTVILRRTGDVAVVAAVYHAVAGADPAWLATDALLHMMTSKPSGRLYKALVEKNLASEVFGYVFPTAEPGIIFFGAKVRPGGSPERARDVLLRVVEGVAKSKLTPAELERWRTATLKDFELALTDTTRVGVELSDWAAMGDWRLFFLTRDRAKQVALPDVVAAAERFLKPSNRTLGMFLPTEEPDRAPAPTRVDVADLMKDFKGSAAVSEGEVFAATLENIESRTTRSELPGGLKLALLPKKTKGGVVELSLSLRFGSEKELRGKTAAAELVPRMLIRGTKKHTFQALRDAFDRLKADISFGGGRLSRGSPGEAEVHIKTVRESLPEVLTLLTEVLREPTFPRAEFETMRKEVLARFEEERQDPMANGFRSLLRQIFPVDKNDVRYIPSIEENIAMLRRLSAGQLATLHRNLWGSGSAQIALVGDFDAAAVKTQLEKELAGWKARKPYQRIEHPFHPGVAKEEAINTPDKEMALVAVGHPIAIRDDDPQYPALVLLNHILGGSASSRLMDRLRQKDGLSYTAFSSMNARPQDESGIFFAGAICAPQNADKAMAALLEEVTRIASEGILATELADAKKNYEATFKTQLADDTFVGRDLTKQLYLGRTMAYWTKLNAAIAKVSAAELGEAAKKHIRLGELAKVKAGDLAKAASAS